jgi:hypothetical protein
VSQDLLWSEEELPPALEDTKWAQESPVLVEKAHTKDGTGYAVFNTEKTHRYLLARVWDKSKPQMGIIMLNPSTADELKLDPTNRRVCNLALRENMGGMWVGNLYALRSTDPKGLKQVNDPTGPLNDAALVHLADTCDTLIAAWGTHGTYLGRSEQVLGYLRKHPRLLTGELKLKRIAEPTKEGHPRHPLYLPQDAALNDI